MKFGMHLFVTDRSLGPADMAREAEEAGLDAIFVGDHSHIPAENETVDGLDELPLNISCYARFYDLFLALTVMAEATSRITLGTGICLVPMREPLGLAKQVATLDHLAEGRLLLGVGAGWNHAELENHGVDPSHRFGLIRERVLAMKEIWANDVAHFHGRHVDFSGVMSWPKPLQDPHPPILIAGHGPKAVDRVFDYGDGWAPDAEGGIEQIESLAPLVEVFHRRRAESGRDDMPLICYGMLMDEACVAKAAELGFDMCVFGTTHGGPAETSAQIQRAAELARALV